MGRFSSDRSIREYCKGIWDITRFESEAKPVLAGK
jgi:Carbohydrate phosphorylase